MAKAKVRPFVTIDLEAEKFAQAAKLLREAPADVKKGLRKGLAESAVPMVKKAKAGAPLGENRHGLRRSIGVKTGRTRTLGVLVGSPKLHAPIREFGKQATITGPIQRPHVRHLNPPPKGSPVPQPWLMPAIDSERRNVAPRVERVIQSFLDRKWGAA